MSIYLGIAHRDMLYLSLPYRGVKLYLRSNTSGIIVVIRCIRTCIRLPTTRPKPGDEPFSGHYRNNLVSYKRYEIREYKGQATPIRERTRDLLLYIPRDQNS